PANEAPPNPALPWSADEAFNRGVQAGLAFAAELLRCPWLRADHAPGALEAAAEFAKTLRTPPGDPALWGTAEEERRKFVDSLRFFCTLDQQQWVSSEELLRDLERIASEESAGHRNGHAQ